MADKLKLDRSLELWQRATKVISGGSQTNSKRPQPYAPGAFPIYLERGEGCRVWDADGNEYIDYISALGPIILGHRYPAVEDAVRAQLEQCIISPLLHSVEVEAAELICDTVPCAEMVRFVKSGAEATSACARLARAYTGREVILNCGYRGWHDTWTAQHATHAGVPECLTTVIDSFAFNDLDSVRQKLDRHEGNVALIFLDAVSSTPPAEGFLQGLRDLADEHGCLLAYDEIVTGFRLAPGGAQEYYGVLPDLAAFAKAMANGMPVGAVCGRREVMDLAQDLLFSTTYGGEALSLAAVVACLTEYQAKPIHEHIWAMGRALWEGFERAGEETGIPLKCRGEAIMAAQYFDVDDAQLSTDLWTFFLQELAKRGVLLRRGGLVFVTYSHGEAEVEETLSAAREVLALAKDHLDRGSLQDALETGDIEESFRRF